MSQQKSEQTNRATRSLFNIKKNRKSTSVEPTPLSMKVININNFKNLLKKQSHPEWSEQIYRNRVQTSESRNVRSSTQGQNRIYIKRKKEQKYDEINFSDYKIKFGKDINDYFREAEEGARNQGNQGNTNIQNVEDEKQIQINNYFNEAINQKPIEMNTKDIFKPKGRIIFKRETVSKSQRRSNLPFVKNNSSYQHYRLRASILEENENTLDGWKDQNPIDPIEQLDPKLDITYYTKKWDTKYMFQGMGKR